MSDEAGTSTPGSSTSRRPELPTLITPAPVEAETPAAPPPKPIPTDLPESTPSSSRTPLNRPDVSEFDPFTTPMPTVKEPKKVEEPVFNFSGFLKDLRTKPAEPIARYLKSFLSNFAKKPFTINEQIKLIHDFLRFIAEKMALYDPWKSQTSAEFDNAMEAMEKLVMNRLYNYTFTPQLVPSQPITTDDLERDAVFSQRVRLFGWVREQHLDVPKGEASQGFLGFAEQELLKINHYKAPRDKMICILNCCKVIFGLIRHTHGASPEATSADAFVPLLIFVVLRANPDNLLSNVEYINRFRSYARLQGESGYYLSSLSGAIAFIETMDASSLSNITQEEFENNVEKAIQDLPPSPSAASRRPFPPGEMSPFAATTPGEEAARPLTFPSLDNTRKFIQRTGNLAQEAVIGTVSKPLTAISKILEGMQQEGSEDGSGDEGGARGESLYRQGLLAETPQKRGGNSPVTPDSPSRRFAQMDINDDPMLSRGGTPSLGDVPMPDFAHLQSTMDVSSEQHAQLRRANVQTLHQMFPALDEDVVEAVLEACNEDLGMAIDSLLEM